MTRGANGPRALQRSIEWSAYIVRNNDNNNNNNNNDNDDNDDSDNNYNDDDNDLIIMMMIIKCLHCNSPTHPHRSNANGGNGRRTLAMRRSHTGMGRTGFSGRVGKPHGSARMRCFTRSGWRSAYSVT